MSYSPNLLKNLGIKLAMMFTQQKRPAEIRLFQAILLQAFEDSLSMSGFKRETYWKEDSYKWFLEDGKDFQYVCWNADMDPQVVRDEFVKLMKNGKIKFTELQKSWINYREFYKHYRNAKTKEEREEVKRKIYSDKVRIK
jgi:predicted DNA-binding transcriptional regulator